MQGLLALIPGIGGGLSRLFLSRVFVVRRVEFRALISLCVPFILVRMC